MFRKDLIPILHNRPSSLIVLSRLLDEDPKDIEDDIHHLFKSLKNTAYQGVILPATCRKCSFVFSKEKIRKPGKCPKCKGTWTRAPLVSIEDKKGA